MALSDVNLNDVDTFEKGTPHEWFKTLRAESPVHRHPGAPGQEDYWCITKHADLKIISKNPGLFSSEEKAALIIDPDEGSLAGLRAIMLNMDPPRHRQYRALINKAFTPRMVLGLQQKVDAMVKKIINAVVEKGECDFVEDLAAPLPMEVICEMMGIPEEDRRAIYELGNRMVGFDDPELQENVKVSAMDDDYQAASAEMFMYAEKLKQRVRENPGDDLATALLNAEVDGEKLSDFDFNSFFLLLAVAGNETTRTVTSNGMLQLMRHPDQQRELAADPGLLNTAVEEILRYDPAVHCFRRTAMQDTEVRGVPIEAGDKVIIWYPAANRDEEVFDDADRFDIRRTPNDHLSFGVGEHFCLGANLARMELRSIFGGIMQRLPDLRLAGEPRRLRSNFINGVKEMRVEFTPSAAL